MDAAKCALGTGTKREAKHVRQIHLPNQSQNNNLVDRLNGAVRGRHKNVRRLKSPWRPLTAGQATYYNLVRPHAGLGGMTPGQAAGLAVPTEGNRWTQLIRAANQHQTETKENAPGLWIEQSRR